MRGSATSHDWDVRQLGCFGVGVRGVSYDPQRDLVLQDEQRSVRLLRANNIADGVLNFNSLQRVHEEVVGDDQFLRTDDIVICGANGSKRLVGKAGRFRDQTNLRYTFGAFTNCFRTNSEQASPSFINHLLQSDQYRVQVEVALAGSSINNLSSSQICRFEFAVPGLSEQVAIAAVLDDVAAQVETLERLIAKKRDIKAGALEALLTGRRRLPGHSGKWTTAPLKELCAPTRERLDPEDGGQGLVSVELEHMESATGRLLGSRILGGGESQKTVFAAGDVLFGKLRAYLRKSWLADRSGLCSTEIWALRSNAATMIPEYLAQLVRGSVFNIAAGNTHGTHMPRSEWAVVGSTEFAVPALDEQRAIGTVLHDMDDEVDALETQLAKVRYLQVGMAQELLTGKTRLV